MVSVYIRSKDTTLCVVYPISFQPHIDILFPETHDKPTDIKPVKFVIRKQNPDHYSFRPEDGILIDQLSADKCAVRLMNEAVRVFAGNHKQHIALHAAAVVKGELALVIPAMSGQGKTSLSAWLTTKGYDYITDELVLFLSCKGDFDAVYRPLNIKPTGYKIMQSLKQPEFDDTDSIETDSVKVWPIESVGKRAGMNQSFRAKVLIFPQYRKHSALQITSLSSSLTGLELMRCNVNARNLSHQGFDLVTQLAQALPAIRIKYGDFKQLENVLDQTLESILH